MTHIRYRLTSSLTIMFAMVLGAAHLPVVRATDIPNKHIGSEQYPNDDAIILQLDQQWTEHADGRVSYREHRWTKVLSLRPARELADPRIDYQRDVDTVTIHVARTHLPSGETLDVPEYSFNSSAPHDIGGWPAWAQWQQTVISYSGFQPGAVLELDYEVTTQPGVYPWISHDLKLHEDFPIVQRSITVTAPDRVQVSHEVLNMDRTIQPTIRTEKNMKTIQWTFDNLESRTAEPLSEPWHLRCGRLVFTTCPGHTVWMNHFAQVIEQASTPTPEISEWANAIAGDATHSAEKLDRLTNALQAAWSFIDADRTWRDLKCRSADEVLRTHYGNTLETAALLLACARSLNIDATPLLAVDSQHWHKDFPIDDCFAGFVISARGMSSESELFHAQHGRLHNPGQWGPYTLFDARSNDPLDPHTHLTRRGQLDGSRFELSGTLNVDDQLNLTGRLHMRLTGSFYEPWSLGETNAQKNHLQKWLSRTVSDLEIKDHALVTLSDEKFEAFLEVKSKNPLNELTPKHVRLSLGQGPAFLQEIALPIAGSSRQTPLYLACTPSEFIHLSISLPKTLTAHHANTNINNQSQEWGRIAQSIQSSEKQLKFVREINLKNHRIAPHDFKNLRNALNDLNALGHNEILFSRE